MDGASVYVWICATIVQLHYFIVRLSLSRPKARTAFFGAVLFGRNRENYISQRRTRLSHRFPCACLSTGNRNAGTKDTKSCDGENKFDGIKSKRNCRSSIALIWQSPSNVHPTTLPEAAYAVRSGGVAMGRWADISPHSFSGEKENFSALPTIQIIPSENGTQQQRKRASERKKSKYLRKET